MVTSETQKLKQALGACQEALVWASGSADFGPGGKARKGWLKLARPAIEKAARLA